MNNVCPKCESNLVSSNVVDPNPPIIVHYCCERCGMEWVE